MHTAQPKPQPKATTPMTEPPQTANRRLDLLSVVVSCYNESEGLKTLSTRPWPPFWRALLPALKSSLSITAAATTPLMWRMN